MFIVWCINNVQQQEKLEVIEGETFNIERHLNIFQRGHENKEQFNDSITEATEAVKLVRNVMKKIVKITKLHQQLITLTN